jgi:tRNA dihydrouridine synthase A
MLRTSSTLLSLAPMMEITDRHFRAFLRLLTRRTTLYTEMYVANTLLHAPQAAGMLRFSPQEHPIACQIGGSDPEALARAAALVEAAGYDEVNLNCGCPSPRVAGKGSFGARLMFTPELVRDCVAAMRAAVSIPVTVKCRLGADDMDAYEDFSRFVRVVAQGGCTHFIVHARKCLLKGLDPKGNRTVPPLRYAWVQRVALENPGLRISLNGGLTEWGQVEQLLSLTRPVGAVDAAAVAAAVEAAAAAAAAAAAEAAAGGGVSGGAGAGAGGAQGPAGEGAGQRHAAEGSQETCGEAECSAGGGGGGSGGWGSTALGAGSEEEEEEGEGGAQQQQQQSAAAAAPAPAPIKHDAHLGSALPASQFLPQALLGPPVAIAPGAYGGQGALLESCMIGRAAYNTPWMFGDVDRRFFGAANPGLSRREVLEAYVAYVEGVLAGVPAEEHGMSQYRPFVMAKPLISLFQGEYGGARFRRTLSVALQDKKLGLREAVAEAAAELQAESLDARW